MTEYKYKDGNRYWWKLVVKKGSPEVDDRDPEIVDYWWDYSLSKEDEVGKFKSALKDTIKGQYDIEPSVRDIMEHAAKQFLSVAIGFSCHGFPLGVEPRPKTSRS